ncbi:DUF4235 domain-containing protein [Mangrovihabitans endophyticus]|uniref:Membrane protein n=1 Tax=Mangrovihabitans endophyticus TaxID=1751298 RepID=A0A8J3BXQ5_9ACTN|nr:DUF4235 domain-containing protein [Mangrovihabitans endophyticus]GGK85473.1 membrane protein [Mangrovihabitans endophyticus]
MSTKLEKIAMKPVNIALGFGAGAIAGMVFKKVWKLTSGQDDAPDAHDEERGWGEIIAAAAIQGLIFSVVRTAVARSGAIATKRLTGTWPD